MTNHEFSLLLALLLVVVGAVGCFGMYGLLILFDRLRNNGRKESRRRRK